jgi:hypothetical protein
MINHNSYRLETARNARQLAKLQLKVATTLHDDHPGILSSTLIGETKCGALGILADAIQLHYS